MLDTKISEWLLNNADDPIRYRVVRELLKDDIMTESFETKLLQNSCVQIWINNLKPNIPPQHWSMEHGSFDFCLENALPKIVGLGLHGGLPQVTEALSYYIRKMQNIQNLDFYVGKMNNIAVENRKGKNFFPILIANFLSSADVIDNNILKFLLGSLNEMYSFVEKKIYDIYLAEDERKKLKKVPKNWKNTEYFIRPDLIREYGFSFPFIYDIVGLSSLYKLKNHEIDKKIDTIISYIATDEFHNKMSNGYGILVEEDGKYHGMGWDPKFPGWFSVSEYIKTENVPKLLFFALHISKYHIARKTKWFCDLLEYLEKYRTETGTYIFPKEWLKESQGYAVQGHHISFDENRRKKNWCEIESTFYMQLLSCDN